MIQKELAIAIRHNRTKEKSIDENMMNLDLGNEIGITTNVLAKLGRICKYIGSGKNMQCIAIYKILQKLFQMMKGKYHDKEKDC